MDNNQIVEQGTQDELLALNGIYAGLWRVQSGNEDKEKTRLKVKG